MDRFPGRAFTAEVWFGSPVEGAMVGASHIDHISASMMVSYPRALAVEPF